VHGWHAAMRGGCVGDSLHFDEEVSVDDGGVEPDGAAIVTGDNDVADFLVDVMDECFR
jgi:hypothetical protein